jgi:hypothetical protein
MKPFIALLLFVLTGVFGCGTSQQVFKIVNGSYATHKFFHRDEINHFGVAVAGSYKVLSVPHQNNQVKLRAVQSVIEIDLENRSGGTLELNTRKFQLISTNFFYETLQEFIARNKMELRVKDERVSLPPGKPSQKIVAVFVADFADSVVVFSPDHIGTQKLGKGEELVLVWNDALTLNGVKMSVPPIRFKPEE